MHHILYVLFFLRKSSKNCKGPVPLFARLTLNSQRSEISLGIKWDSDRWNSESEKAVGNKEDAKALNDYVENFRYKIRQTKINIENEGKVPSLELIKDYITGNNKSKRLNIIDVFQDHNNSIRALVGKEYAKGTLTRYETTKKHLSEFIFWKYKRSEYNLVELDHAFVTGFEFYLRSVRNCDSNTAFK